MKPNLSDKHIIFEIIKKNNNHSYLLNKENNILFFNFLFILFLIICILFLVFRYIEKNKKRKEDLER
jgi:hypothetical protein